MKLRIYRNSLRFRLTPREVAQLEASGIITETIGFGPDDEFSYSLRAHSGIDQIQATLQGRAIFVEIPRSLIHDWSRSDAVGLQQTQPTGNGKTLQIAVEKDFECLEGKTQEPGEVFYPNPMKDCAENELTIRQ